VQQHVNVTKGNKMINKYIPDEINIGSYIALLFNEEGHHITSLTSPDPEDFEQEFIKITKAHGSYLVMKVIDDNLGRTVH